MEFPGNSLMLLDEADRNEAAALVKRLAFGRRIQHDSPWIRRREQRIHELRPVAAPLGGIRDDDHPGGSMGLAVRPPGCGPYHRAGPLQNKAMAQLQCKIPVLDAIGPRYLLRELQGA